VIPAPAVDEQAASGAPAISETVVLAGGCFWGVQGVFQHVSGVSSAVSGYAGGEKRHDPTQLNRQGPDVGTQYRSAIFPLTAEQARVAKAYIAQLNQARVYDAAIVTKIEPNRDFYPAEDYHQDYMTLHPAQPYIVYNDLPKIDDLKTAFPNLYRADPVLVAARASN
jgi:peptide-methionine (S)-S-oxide reductase